MVKLYSVIKGLAEEESTNQTMVRIYEVEIFSDAGE